MARYDASSLPPLLDEACEVPESSVFDRAGPERRRYELRRLIGEGGTSRVYAAFDHDLQREVAIKFIRVTDPAARARAVDEARVMASLGHPGILPIYDVGTTNDLIYLTMPCFTGHSLGAVVRAAVAEARNEALPITQLVEVFLKLCDALAYAHARGVVHRDIKPDNVLIGDYGEVVLVDWGAASAPCDDPSGAPPAMGTPAYMPPEQVHGVRATTRSDVYALGATLFYTLLSRKPLDGADPTTFWYRKSKGEFDPPTAEELARVPRAVLRVAMKAMSADPAGRYRSAGEFAQSLRDFLAGRSAWAAPSLREDFKDDGHLDRWVSVAPGDFVREDGRLVSRCQAGGLLIYKQRLAAGVAVEFDGEILDGAQPGDLSVLWTEEDLLEGGPHWPTLDSTFTLQVGAYANMVAGIYRGYDRCLAGRSLSIAVARKYRIRAEINEQSMRVLLDGELITEYEDIFPIRSGYLALYSYYPGKAFSNLEIYERGMPERVSPTAIGDAFYAREDYDQATLHYLRVEQLLPRTAIAEEARYKRGLSRLTAGDARGAAEAWSGLADHTWRARAELHSIDAAFKAGEHAPVLDGIRRLLRTTPALRTAITARWTEYVNQLCTSDFEALAGYIELRDEQFPGHLESAAAAASAELARGQFRAVLERFPEQHLQVINAHLLLGDFESVVEHYARAPWLHQLALVLLCRFDDPELSIPSRSLVTLLRGDPEASLATHVRAEALLAAGRFEEVLTIPAEPEERAAALRGLGRQTEALERGDARSLALANVGEEALARRMSLSERIYLTEHLALKSLLEGDRTGYCRHRDSVRGLPCAAIWSDNWVALYLLFPLADEHAGESGAFAASLRESIRERATHRYGMLRHIARYVLGEVTEREFIAQPCQLYIEARLRFARALRAEHAGDRVAAERAYRAYLALPPSERHLDSPLGNILVDRWAESRIQALQPTRPASGLRAPWTNPQRKNRQ